MKTQIYLFSGLGADERVFKNLIFEGYSPIFISWIIPLKNEKIEHYAKRLLPQIKQKNPTIIGLSFGGMMAVEIAKQIPTNKLILISSAKTKSEIPFYFRFLGNFKIHKLLPTSVLKSSNFVTNWFFGVITKQEKILLKEILQDTNPIFLKWAIDKIVNWKNVKTFKNMHHIHGDNDKILPSQFTRNDASIKNGGHLMVLKHSDEINILLKNQLEKI